MAYDLSLADRITDVLTARRVNFTTKKMFGGVLAERLMVRLDPAREAEAMQRPGCQAMDFTKRPMKGFVFVNAAGYDDDAHLEYWLDLALGFNPRAKASKK
jgi:hypothetical protein